MAAVLRTLSLYLATEGGCTSVTFQFTAIFPLISCLKKDFKGNSEPRASAKRKRCCFKVGMSRKSERQFLGDGAKGSNSCIRTGA